MTYYFNRAGEPITSREWGWLFADARYQVLRQDEVYDYLISTVWLGIDHGFGVTDAPLIFETMVFKGDRSDLDCQRYSTEAEALKGHERACEEVRVIAAATEGIEAE